MIVRVCSVDRGGPGNLKMHEHDIGADTSKPTRIEIPGDAVASLVAVDGDVAIGIGNTIGYLTDGRMHSMHTTLELEVVLTPVPRLANLSPEIIASYLENLAVTAERRPATPKRGSTVEIAISPFENGMFVGMGNTATICLDDPAALELADKIYRLCGLEPPERHGEDE